MTAAQRRLAPSNVQAIMARVMTSATVPPVISVQNWIPELLAKVKR